MDFLAFKEYPSALWPVYTGYGHEGSAFPCTIATDEADDFSFLNLYIYSFKCLYRPIGGIDVFEFKHTLY